MRKIVICLVLITGLLALNAQTDTKNFNYYKNNTNNRFTEGTVSSDFGPRIYSGAYQFHNGVDFGTASNNKDVNCPYGTKLLSLVNGIVTDITSAKQIKIQGQDKNNNLTGYNFSYMHIFNNAPLPAVGQGTEYKNDYSDFVFFRVEEKKYAIINLQDSKNPS